MAKSVAEKPKKQEPKQEQFNIGEDDDGDEYSSIGEFDDDEPTNSNPVQDPTEKGKAAFSEKVKAPTPPPKVESDDDYGFSDDDLNVES